MFYALAPILYTTGIILGTVLFAGRYGIVATAWGAVAGAVAHLAIRAIGTRRTIVPHPADRSPSAPPRSASSSA